MKYLKKFNEGLISLSNKDLELIEDFFQEYADKWHLNNCTIPEGPSEFPPSGLSYFVNFSDIELGASLGIKPFDGDNEYAQIYIKLALTDELVSSMNNDWTYSKFLFEFQKDMDIFINRLKAVGFNCRDRADGDNRFGSNATLWFNLIISKA